MVRSTSRRPSVTMIPMEASRALLTIALASTLLLTACPKPPADGQKSDDVAKKGSDQPAAASGDLIKGAPMTPDGQIDQEALKLLAFLPALQARTWDGTNFVWGADIEPLPEWEQTPPFDAAYPIPEMAIQPDPYILAPPEAPGGTAVEQALAEEKAKQQSADAEAESKKRGDDASPREDAGKERRTPPPPPPPPGPNDWVMIPVEAGPIEVAYKAFTYEAEGLTLTGYGAIPQNIGAAPVVILLHGLIPKDRYNVSTHAREARYLASRGYLVLVPNFRNYGASSVVDENPELLRLGYLRDAVNLVQVVRMGRIEQSNPGKIALWGVGHGGSLALKAAVLTRPSAVFVQSPTGGQESNDQELFANGMAPDIAASMDAMYGKADNPATITWYRSMTYSNFLADVGCPVGIIAGELDPIIKVDQVRQMMAILTPVGVQAMMSTFPRTGHDFYGQDWISLMMTAEQFLRQPLQPMALPATPAG